MENRAGFRKLEGKLKRSFHSPELLERALTHSSHAHESQLAAEHDNELLEFLGDAVLGFVTSEALFERFPDRREGELSKLRAHLVSARHLVRAAKELDLGSFLLLGRGEEKSGGRSKSALLSDALEAVIAAIYLDGGMEAVRPFIVSRIVEPGLQSVAPQGAEVFKVTDYKSALQESVQAMGHPQPKYRVTKESGPDHKKIFTVELRVKSGGAKAGTYVAQGEGRSKKDAEQRAAKQALEHLQQVHSESSQHAG